MVDLTRMWLNAIPGLQFSSIYYFCFSYRGIHDQINSPELSTVLEIFIIEQGRKKDVLLAYV